MNISGRAMASLAPVAFGACASRRARSRRRNAARTSGRASSAENDVGIETAILGLGAIIREPVALEDGTLTSRQQMTLSLTFDHRILDGAPAARFLQTLRQRLESPVAWLI